MSFLGFYRLFFVSILILGLVSCNNSENKTALTKRDILFKKEGTLILKKANSDSIVKTLDIEIADDDYQTQTGLMYRNNLGKNQGMLFIFPDEKPRSFYMKNTRIALDIIYISAGNKIVSIQKNAEPFNETSLPSNFPAKYVLEINASLSDTWNLQTGDTIDFTTN